MSNKNAVSPQSTATEESLSLLIDTTPAFIHTALPDGALDFLNHGWLEYVGLSLTDLLGWRWTTAIHPEDVEEFVDKWRASVASGDPFVAESRVRRADGEYRWFLHRKVPLRDETGKIVKWYGSSLEIENRKWAEVELRRSEAYLSEAQRLSHTGSFGWDLLSGEIYWSDETFRIFELETKTKITTDLILQRTHPDDRQAVQQLLERASSERTEFALEHRLLIPDGPIKYLRVVGRPLQDEGRRSEFVGAVTDITDQRQAEESLRESKSYLAEAQKLSHTGSWAWRPDTDVRYWSEECYRVLGFDPRDGLPRSEAFFQAIHPDDRPRFSELTERAIREKEGFEAEYRIVHPGGAVRDIRVVSHPVLSPCGDLIEFTGTVIDVTERKRAEEKLRASERKYRHLVDTTPAFIHTALPDGSLDFLSRGWLEYGGLAQTDLLDWRWTEAIHPEDVEGFVDKWRAALASGEPFEAESRVRRADGEYRWFLQRNVPLRDETGKIVKWYGTGIDIEERKRAEKELRASERKYRDLVDTTPAFVNTALPNGDIDFFNRGWEEYAGLPFMEMLGWRWTSAIHPEDVEAFVGKWRAALESGQRFVAEARVRRADGEYRWFLQCSEPLRNEAGEIVKWYGTGIEIEERKIAEQEIRAKEIELQQIVNLSPQHIGVFASSGGPLYLNRAGLEYFGATEWGADEGGSEATHPWPGSRIDLVHPEDRDHFVSERKKGFLEGRPFEHEARLLRHDGQFRCFLVRFAPLKDERGDITRWIGTGTDIEDRKRAEEEIKKENIVLREEIDKTSMFEEIVGVSAPLQSVLTDVSKVAPTDSTVLITGETGTGKELVARAIHKRSRRSARAFVSVNCAAIPSSLIASELFGHEKGAFTGATQRRQGRFELAEGGTIFLDEVGELPAEIQIALLRVLQEREFERVGGGRPIRADLRVIAATNRDLETAIAEKTFRSDLYYRLNVFPVVVPPLRERPEDIPLLVEYFIHRFAKRAGKKINRISKKTLDIVESYGWPGNVRELQNVVERAVIVSDSNELYIDERWLSGRRTKAPVDARPNQRTALRSLTTSEKEAIESALTESKGRVSGPFGAAARLGLPSSTLESKIKVLKIDKRTFKQQ
jgi:PAS domain S-box-containing protein